MIKRLRNILCVIKYLCHHLPAYLDTLAPKYATNRDDILNCIIIWTDHSKKCIYFFWSMRIWGQRQVSIAWTNKHTSQHSKILQQILSYHFTETENNLCYQAEFSITCVCFWLIHIVCMHQPNYQMTSSQVTGIDHGFGTTTEIRLISI